MPPLASARAFGLSVNGFLGARSYEQLPASPGPHTRANAGPAVGSLAGGRGAGRGPRARALGQDEDAVRGLALVAQVLAGEDGERRHLRRHALQRLRWQPARRGAAVCGLQAEQVGPRVRAWALRASAAPGSLPTMSRVEGMSAWVHVSWCCA